MIFTDTMIFADQKQKYTGLADKTAAFLTKEQLTDVSLWKKFVQQFRDQLDGTNEGWRGEYWGKMMRGASLCYYYSKDEKLYAVLENTVKDLLETQDQLGRISAYSVESEFCGWDMWARKYILLGNIYFYMFFPYIFV